MKLTKRTEQTIVFEDQDLSATVRIEHHERGERKWSAAVHVLAFADTEPGVIDAIGLRLVQIANELTKAPSEHYAIVVRANSLTGKGEYLCKCREAFQGLEAFEHHLAVANASIKMG